jgi:two-component system CheB/CheR fusion protein
MTVEQARDRTKVVPNRVYIIPPNATLTIKNSVLQVKTPVEARGHRTPIDSLFSSLAEDCGENAVCIMLSGTGTDGTVGLRAIKEYGGMAMAQTLESAKYDAILRSAIATGLVDHVLPVEEMPAKLLEYVAHLSSTNGKTNNIDEQMSTHVGKIHSLLRRRAGHDFSQYKENTITRRLSRRMKALQIESVEQYAQLLEREPAEADRRLKARRPMTRFGRALSGAHPGKKPTPLPFCCANTRPRSTIPPRYRSLPLTSTSGGWKRPARAATRRAWRST